MCLLPGEAPPSPGTGGGGTHIENPCNIRFAALRTPLPPLPLERMWRQDKAVCQNIALFTAPSKVVCGHKSYHNGIIKNVPSQSLSEVQNIIATVGRPVHTMPFFLSSGLRTSKEQRLDTLNLKYIIGTRRHKPVHLQMHLLTGTDRRSSRRGKSVNPN